MTSIVSDAELLLKFDGMYSGDDGDVRMYSAKVVRPKRAKKCPGNFAGALHDVVANTRGVTERALIDGEWCSCYTCEECILAWAKRGRGLL